MIDVGGTPVVQSSSGHGYGAGWSAGVGGFLGSAIGNGGLFGNGYRNGNGADLVTALDNQNVIQALYGINAAIPNQTIALENFISNGNQTTLSAISSSKDQLTNYAFAIDKDVLESKYANAIGQENTNQLISNGLYAQTLNNKNDFFSVMSQLKDCCCETNLNVTNSKAELSGQIAQGNFDTQLRDLQNTNDINNRLNSIECLIKDTAKNQELSAAMAKINELQEEKEKNYLANIVRSSSGYNACLTNQLGDALKVQFGPTFPWNIPNCSPCNGFGY